MKTAKWKRNTPITIVPSKTRLTVLLAAITILLVTSAAHGQMPEVKLSHKHVARINSTKSVANKIRKYKRYFQRDSLRQARRFRRYLDKQLDSLADHYAKPPGMPVSVPDSLPSVNDSLFVRNALKRLEQRGVLENINVPDLSTSLPDIAADAPFNIPEGVSDLDQDFPRQIPGKLPQADLIKSFTHPMPDVVPAEWRMAEEQMTTLGDSASRAQHMKKMSGELAGKLLEEYGEVPAAIKLKMAALMRKYSIVPNSNDLSSATKLTSLKGQPLGRRLNLALNFQLLSTDPFVIDVAPGFSYRFNTRLSVGGGLTYRQSFANDSIQFMSKRSVGYRTFSSFEVLNQFFLYGEYQRFTTVSQDERSPLDGPWSQTIIGGVGRRLPLTNRIDIVVLVGYNFTHKDSREMYPRPWIVRLGIQSRDGIKVKSRQ